MGACSGVRPITEQDKADIAAFPFSSEDELAQLGATAHIGEEGFNTLERQCAPRQGTHMFCLWAVLICGGGCRTGLYCNCLMSSSTAHQAAVRPRLDLQTGVTWASM